MADTAKPTQGKGQKPNKKTMLIVGGAALAILVFLYLHKKSSESAGTKATEPGSEGLSNQSFIPVTGENVAGIGAGSGGGASGESGGGNSQVLTEFFTQEQQSTREYMQSQQAENREARQGEREYLSSLFSNLGTGGGASTEKAPPGVVVAPPQGGATPPPGAAPKPSSPSVPMNNVKCGNGCAGHEYPKGKNGKGAKVTECQVKNAKKQCVWP